MITSSVVWKVMLGASLLGAAAALVGTFAILRRRALVGDMLAHAALPGIALAFLLVKSRDMVPLSIGALLAGLAGVFCVALIARWTSTAADAAIGIVLSTFFGAGVVLLSIIQTDRQGNQAGLNSYLFGEIASLQSRDVKVIATTAAVLLVLVLLFYKELKILAFDNDFATAQGWPTFWLDLAVMAAIAVVTVIGLPVCGVVLMAAMLITPAAAARMWSSRLGPMLAIAAVLGALSAAAGCLLAAPKLTAALHLQWLPLVSSRGMPPGPTIVLAGAGVLLVSMMLAPEHGWLARWWSERRMHRRIASDHVLRGLYELGEEHTEERPWISRASLLKYGAWGWGGSNLWLRREERKGNVELQGGEVRFTPQGLDTATKLVRAHRLWELYLLEDTQRAADEVHEGADAVEHLLPPAVIEHLEEMLLAEGRIEATGEVPPSPHEIRPE